MYAGHMTDQRNRSALFDLVGTLARRRHQIGDRGFAALGLNHTEARLLTLLARQNGEATQDSLSSMLFIDRSNAGRALKGLEQRGFVERGKEVGDARTNSVRMTPEGQAAAAKVAELREGLARGFFGRLTEAQAGEILSLLKDAIDLPESSAGND